MGEVYELEFIGRGGQGAKTAAELVAKIALSKGKFIQSFPDYGPERKGAPVRAFTRISDSKIRGCSSEANPDVIVIIDPTLLSLNGTFFTTREYQTVIVNTPLPAAEVKKKYNIAADVYTLDATSIALKHLKANITNSAMLGALSAATRLFTIDEIKKEFSEEFSKKLEEAALTNNFNAIQESYEQITKEKEILIAN